MPHYIEAEVLPNGSIGQYDVFTVDKNGRRLPPPDLRSTKQRRGERRLALVLMGVKKQGLIWTPNTITF
jgi:hypothetical protein